ncbi:alanine racemase [Sphingomonas sp. DBB INV C78]|uniref:alanine racemase n=1 Tax=Sphingomonas sp. DBB INV C78 TaxID=3349434 RepID=UPI0036D3A628
MDVRLPIGVGVTAPVSPLRLDFDSAALVANWRWFAAASGRAVCGAAIKADGYGLGARAVRDRLAAAGCRDFFVATWDEAVALGPLADGLSLSVLHGLRDEDVPRALAGPARPVLNSAQMVARWKASGARRACDVMIDTGMNRLGLTPEEARSGLLDGLDIDTLLSHLACADEPGHPMNEQQLFTFRSVKAAVPARRYSLANSAGVCLGQRYAFGLTRPGLGLYGGVPAPGADGQLHPVVRPHAQAIQIRIVPQGATVGYGATFTAAAATRVAILNLGYADGYLRAFGEGRGRALIDGLACPVLGRVSMDLVAIDITEAPAVAEGDWIEIDYDLSSASAATGLSQYELLTSLGRRYQRCWI